MSRRGQTTDEPLLPTGTETTGKSSCSIGRVFIALIILGAAAAGAYFIYKATTKGSDGAMPGDVADTIQALMNAKLDPCDDYYEYACGTWRSKEPSHASGRGPYVRSFNILAAQTQKETIAILNDYDAIQPFIKACVNEQAVQDLGYKPLKPFWEVINNISDSQSFWRAMGTLQRSGLATDAMIGFGVDSIDLVYRMLLVGVNPGTNVLFRPLKNETSIYNVLKVLQQRGMTDVPVDQLRSVAIEYLKFEMDFYNNVLRGETNLQENNVSMVAPSTLAEWGVDIPSWVIGLSDTTPIGGSAEPLLVVDRVFISYLGFWQRLGAFINGVFGASQTYSLAAVKTYFQIHIIVNSFDTIPEELLLTWAGQQSNGLLKSQSQAYSVRQDKNFQVPKAQPLLRRSTVPGIIDSSYISDDIVGADRLAQCQQVALGYYSDAITKRWVEKYYPSNNKNLGQTLVDRIYAGMHERLLEVDWLDNATREAAVTKWSYIKANVAYDTDWDTYSDVTITSDLFHDFASLASHRQTRLGLSLLNTAVNRNHFPIGTDVMVQNAYYYPNFNSINMLAGLMAEPLFGQRLPDVMNLAAYGFVIGHEITHGFDNHGRLWNGTGFEVDWWTSASTAAFNERAQCVVDQYFGFPIEHFDNIFVNGNSTLGENLADLGGVGVAWRVYKQQPVIDQLMPGSITNDQLFWLSAAQVWCSVATPTQAKWQQANDVHSPGKYRINGPFSNLEGFADTYKCSATSNMGRSKTAKKCSVW